MKIKLVFIFVILLLFIPIVLSKVNYTESGDFDNFYQRGNAIFNSQLNPATDISTSLVIIGNPKKVPLVNDLDGDGVLEIIVLDGINIIIFQNKTLDIAASLTLDAPTTERFSNMITFDIDGDEIAEIILAGEKRNVLHILKYNRSSFSEQIVINMSDRITHTSDEASVSDSGLMTIGCESVNRCLIAYADEQDTGFAGFFDSTNLYASVFNSTNVSNEILLDASESFSVHCPPKIRHIAKADYDLDGNVEFIFTFSEPNTATGDDGDDVHIFWVDVSGNNTVTKELQVFTTEVGEIVKRTSSDTDYLCDDANDNAGFRSSGGSGTAIAEKFFTSPLVFDADLTKSGLETIIGVMTDNNEFIMIAYDKNGNKIREFPLVQESEGQILSNVFKADVFDDSSDTDFCVLAQEATDELIAVTCGTLRDTDGIGLFNLQTVEFRSNTTFGGLFNVSDDFDFHGILSHSIETDASNDVDEVLSTYGVMELDLTGAVCSLTNNCNLNLLFENPKIDGTVVSTDLEGVGLEDLLILTQTNLFYIDDGFTNEPATITEFTTNPCIDSVWKINITVEITITATDPEADLVAVRAILYEGTSNEQDSGFSSNVSSGTSVPFAFIANETVGAGTLRMEAKDVENQETVDFIERSFSVAPNGVEFNDCTTTETFVAVIEEEEEVEASLTEDSDDNSITNSLNAIIGLTGLAGTTLWLFGLIVLSALVWFEGAQNRLSGNSILGTIAILNVLGILLGARLGILSTGLVVIIVVLGVVIIGVFLGKFLTGSSTDT